MSEFFTLYCWIRGTEIEEHFCVKISRFETVDTLRNMVRDLQHLDVPAATLRLYKPSVPVAEPYDENLRKIILSKHGKPLPATRKISSLYKTDPPEEHIHLIVDAPHLNIHCWLRGSTGEERFDISIRANSSMGALKECIKDNDSRLNNVDQSRIRLYRISESEGELRECLDTLNAGHLLEVTRSMPLFHYFLDIPVLERLQVVVQVYTDNNRSTNHPRSARHISKGEEDPIKFARESFLENIDEYYKKKKSQSRGQRSHSPSHASYPSSFRERQRDEKVQIACGRPREFEEPIPVTLLHPAFGEFIDDSHTHDITEEDNNIVYDLANVMSAFYATEIKRVHAVSEVLRGYRIGFRLNSKVPGTSYVTDAEMFVDVHNNHHPFVIAEFKNEMASSGSEPYLQALLYYLESTRTSAPRMSGSALPCFLLIIVGPYIFFAGAVWTLRPVVQILSSPLVFNFHSTDTDNQIAAARHMAAFRKAIRSLERYYETLPRESELVNTLCHPILFPYPTNFKSLDDDSKKSFSYTHHLDEEQAQSKRLIFFGTLTEGRVEVPICIKFVRRYSRDAHLHCARSGVAPKLRGFEPLPGGWFMVVMDRLLAYDVLADLPDTVRLPLSVFEDIGQRLKTLHAQKLVHGDIRDTNILVNQNDRTKFMIIDFDWAGVEDVVLYPPYVNHFNIKRPDDARDGLPIKAAHDNEMIDDIIYMRAQK